MTSLSRPRKSGQVVCQFRSVLEHGGRQDIIRLVRRPDGWWSERLVAGQVDPSYSWHVSEETARLYVEHARTSGLVYADAAVLP